MLRSLVGSEMCIRDRAKWGTITRESRDGSSSSPRSTTRSNTAKGSANGNADFLSRLPEPATEHDRNGSTSLNPVEDGGIHLIRVCGLNTPSSPIPGVGFGGLVPRTESAVLGGLPFTSTDYCDFRTHAPRMRIDDLFASSGGFVCLLYTSPSPRDS